MKERIISNKELKKLKHFNPCAHSESVLYIDKDEVLKFLDPVFADDRKETVERLSEINHKNCITPLYSIIMDDYFSGYAMKYYKKYMVLSKKIIDPSIPYSQRLIIAKQIWEVLNFFKSINYSYIDLHEDNIIINDEFDLQFLDLDSGCFKEFRGKNEYDIGLIMSSNRACIMTLNILFGVKPMNFYENFEKNSFAIKKMLTTKQRVLFEHALEDSHEFDGSEYIDEFDEEIVNYVKNKLKLTLY